MKDKDTDIQFDESADLSDAEQKLRAKKEKKAKRRGCGCGGCLIAIAVVVVLFCGAITGGAFWAWGQFVEPSTGVTLPQALGVLGGFYGGKEEAVVTNPYDPVADLDAFYQTFKSETYLSADTEISLADILSGVLFADKTQPDASPAVAGQKNVCLATGTDGIDREVTTLSQIPTGDAPSTESMNPVLREYLLQLKFDFSDLSQYQGGTNVMDVTDKQFAALVNELFQTLSTQADRLIPDPQLASIAPTLFGNLSVKQVIVNAPDLNDPTQTQLVLTIGCNLREAVRGLIDAQANQIPALSNGFIRGVVRAATGLLPKTIYLSAAIYPYNPSAPADVQINQMDREKIENLFRLIDGLSGAQTNTTFVKINTQVVNMIQKLNEFLPLVFVDSGMEAKPVEGMINAMGLQGVVSESEFLYMIRDVNVKANDPATAENLQIDRYTDAARNTSVNNLLRDMELKYGFDNSDGIVTADNLYAQVSKFAGKQEMIDRLHLERLNYGQTEYVVALHELPAEYMALAEMINGYMQEHPDVMGKLQATALTLEYEETTGTLTLLIVAHLASMVPQDDPVIAHLAGQLLPQSLYIQASIDLDDISVETTLRINDTDAEQSRQTMETVAKMMKQFGIESAQEQFSYQGLCSTIDKAVRDSLTEMEKNLGKLRWTEERCYLPSVFEILSNIPQMKEEGKEDMTPEQIYPVLRQGYTYVPQEKELNVTTETNASKFVTSLQNNYYIREGALDPTDGKLLVSQLKGLSGEFANEFNAPAMVADQRATEELLPVLEEDELGFLAGANADFAQAVGFMENVRVVGSQIDEVRVDGVVVNHTLLLHVFGEVKLGAVTVPDEEQQGKSTEISYEPILPKTVYMQVRVDVNLMQQKIQARAQGLPEPEGSCVDFTVNDMSETVLADFIEMSRRLSQKSFDKEETCKTIDGKLVTAMGDLGGEEQELQPVFSQDKVTLNKTVFALATERIYKGVDETTPVPTQDRMRDLLKGVHAYSDGLADSNAAENLDRLIAEVNGKYYLTDGYRLTEPTQGDPNALSLDDQIARIAANYNAAIDGQLLAGFGEGSGREQPVEALRPYVDEGELVTLLKDKLAFPAQGMQDMQLVAAYVTVGTDGSQSMELRLLATPDRGDGTQSNAAYVGLLPDQVVIRVVVDLVKMHRDMQDVAQDPELHPVCTVITVNDMTGDGTGDIATDDMSLFADVSTRISGKSTDLAQMNRDASDKVRSNMQRVSNGGTTRYETGKIVLDSIYGVAVQEIFSEQTVETRPTDSDFKAMLEGLWNNECVPSDAEHPYLAEHRITTNKNYSSEISGTGYRIRGVVSDRNIAGTLIAGEAEGSQEENLHNSFGVGRDELYYNRSILVRSPLLTDARNPYTCLDGVKGLLTSKMQTNVSSQNGGSNDDYLILAVQVTIQKQDAQDALLQTNTMLPDTMIATVALNLTKLRYDFVAQPPAETAPPAQATFVLFNAMSDAQVELMQRTVQAIRDKDGSQTGKEDLFGATLVNRLEESLLKMALFPGMQIGGTQIAGASLRDMLAYTQLSAEGSMIFTENDPSLESPYFGALRMQMQYDI